MKTQLAKRKTPANGALSEHFYKELIDAINNVGSYGSIEIYIQDHQITQITARSIKKTRHALDLISA